MAKKITRSSTKKTVKPTVKAEPKKIAKSTAKVNSVSKQDSTKTVIDEIKIGDQTWTSKNLDVSTYRNGDVIPQVQNEEEWKNLTSGAWCYYENKTANGKKYGKLYNYYAVNDPRGLAPKGYHIPTDKEWTILTDNLGDEASKKMKSKIGFAGLPGGIQSSNGGFFNIGASGCWWSSSESSINFAWYRYLDSNNGRVASYNVDKHSGLSVRCLKD